MTITKNNFAILNGKFRFPAGLIYGAALFAMILLPHIARACACGCGVFDVGTSSMLPKGAGGMVYLEYDYQSQSINWSGSSRAPAADNGDRAIRTDFITAGFQYIFNRSWGVEVQIPYDYRHFTTTGGASGSDIVTNNWGTLGDIRITGIYTGFSPDLSTGLTFGVKLPTGSYSHNDAYGDIDRDSELGTGSTDLLMGGFHRGQLSKGFTWYVQTLADLPVLIQEGYRPGFEIDSAAGIYYEGWRVGRVKITPVAQVIFSERMKDQGPNATGGIYDDPEDGVSSGYQRLLLSPGIEFDMHPFSLYIDVELPVYDHVTGNQLYAPELVKMVLSYHF
jgi:hypothetical protein